MTTTPLDLAAIRERLDNIDRALEYDITDTALLRRAPDDIAALLDEVERLRSELAPWQTLVEKHSRQNGDLLSEVGRCCRALDVTVKANAALTAEIERLRSEVAQLRIFRCHTCDFPMRLIVGGDADDDGYLYACTRPGCHAKCITSTPQVTL